MLAADGLPGTPATLDTDPRSPILMQRRSRMQFIAHEVQLKYCWPGRR
jgi:hypothetical protein